MGKLEDICLVIVLAADGDVYEALNILGGLGAAVIDAVIQLDLIIVRFEVLLDHLHELVLFIQEFSLIGRPGDPQCDQFIVAGPDAQAVAG